MLQELRYSFRMLVKAPGFTAVAVLTLALGIGANTAIFSAVNGIILRPLPYTDSSRLVAISGYKQFPGGIWATMNFSPEVWRKVREQTLAIEQMALYTSADFTLTGETAPEIVSGHQVSSDFFPTMGVHPIAGRPILPADTQPGAKPVAVMSYSLWRSRWGGDNGALQRTIMLNDKPYTIVGVMPPAFNYPADAESKTVWLPLIFLPDQKGNSGSLGATAVARLKKGAMLDAVNAQLKVISADLFPTLPVFGKGGEFRASALKRNFGDLDKALLILLGAVGFVLLISCVNVSGLLLSRGWGRRREVAIRDALGASRSRIIRQFMAESVLLAFCGGALGVFLSIWGVAWLRAITPVNAPEHGKFLVNANMLWFTLAVSLLAGILFGIAPAIQVSARRIGTSPKGSFGASLTGSLSREPRRLRSVLVIVEIALATMLVVGATLMVRSFEKLTSLNLGFRTDHLLTMRANFPKSLCDTRNTDSLAACQLAVSDVVHRMGAISGVQSAAVASTVPLSVWSVAVGLRIEGQKEEISLDSGALIADHLVSPDYFRTLGIRLLSGRSFNDSDTKGSSRVVLVDETFGHKYLGDHPLGQRIGGPPNKNGEPQWMEVIGEVSDTQDTRLDTPPSGEIYVPFAQSTYFQSANFIARTLANPMAVAPALRQAIWSVSKNTPITDLETMDQVVAESVAEPRFRALLLGAFCALGLVLAMVGIYGVISFSVTQRTREIGVRMALGAQPSNVLRMVLREGMLLAGVGILIGIGGTLALGRFLQSSLFGLKATDSATLIGVAVALALVALVASYIPARSAMRVAPMEALRYE